MDDCGLLDRRSLEGKLYLLFVDPKTQKEAIELLYGKDYGNINIAPFKEARETLVEAGLLSSDGKLRNATFESNLDSVVDCVEADGEAGEMIDSATFRDRFSTDRFEWLPFVARNAKGKIELYPQESALSVIEAVLLDLSFCDRV